MNLRFILRTNIKNIKILNQVKSITRAIDIMKCFLDGEKLAFNEICKKTNLPNGTVYRITQTLMESNFISKDQNSGKYLIGKGIFILGQIALKNYEFEKIAHLSLEELALNTKETANASIFYDNSVIFIDSVESTYSVKMNVIIGQRNYINTSASGKVLIAYLGEEKIKEILDNAPLPRLTKYTITDKELFMVELKKVKELGYAFDNEEEEIDLKCVAGPVFNYKNKVVGALSVAGPATRLENNMDNIISQVKNICAEASSKLGHY